MCTFVMIHSLCEFFMISLCINKNNGRVTVVNLYSEDVITSSCLPLGLGVVCPTGRVSLLY